MVASQSDIIRSLLAGGISNSVASCLLNWSDVIKIRMQTESIIKGSSSSNSSNLVYTSFSKSVTTIFTQEGLLGLLLPGIFPSVMREMSYSSIRFGLYPYVRKLYGEEDGKDAGFIKKIAAGLTTGGIGLFSVSFLIDTIKYIFYFIYDLNSVFDLNMQ